MSRPFYSSYNENAMLVAVIFLLLITILMLLLHFYAKCRFERRRRGIDLPGTTAAASHVRDNQFSVMDDDVIGTGLDPSLVASLPVFVYKAREWESGSGMVCVVCLSVMEEEEKGRMLPKCGHCNFHLWCIDKWLLSHSSCPICRSAVGTEEALALSVSTMVPEEEQGNLDSWGQSPADQNEGVDVDQECGRINMAELTEAPSFSSSCSLKLMLNRDRFESRVHPSVQVDEMS